MSWAEDVPAIPTVQLPPNTAQKPSLSLSLIFNPSLYSFILSLSLSAEPHPSAQMPQKQICPIRSLQWHCCPLVAPLGINFVSEISPKIANAEL